MTKRNDDYDVLTAVWILSCQDEVPLMSYENSALRIGVPVDELRQTIARHISLFRPGATQSQLDERKKHLLQANRFPRYLRELSPEARLVKINAMTRADFFRNIFRTEADAPRPPLEVLEWGLDYIDRLRNARQEGVRKWTTVILPTISTVVACLTLLVGFWTQRQLMHTQAVLKRYEVTARPMYDGYVAMMSAMSKLYDAANAADASNKATLTQLDLARQQWEQSYASIEPFLNEADRQTVIKEKENFNKIVDHIARSGPTSKPTYNFGSCRDAIRQPLFRAIFLKSENP